MFSATDVGHFLDANLFGAPLGATMIQSTACEAFTEFNRAAVIAVGVPLMILAGVATYFNSRASVARQSPEAAANPQTAMMNKLALYVFPLGVVVGGPFLPLAIIMYWVANNIWTFGQQHYVFGKIEKEEEAKKIEALERRAANAPAPGAKPKRRARPQAASTDAATDEARGDRVDGDRWRRSRRATRRPTPSGGKTRRQPRQPRAGRRRRGRAPGRRNASVDQRRCRRKRERQTMTDAETTERTDDADGRARTRRERRRRRRRRISRSAWSPRARSPATTSRSCWTCWTSMATSIWTSRATARS